ncbi:cytochrome c oxidase assembly factor Coa1 family protein [Chitiniphilus eburneus]|uniref:Uncharacterized protein n=1 Tax=Chitiniphilus eburneus TaxID=2571148 RepID=A0A4U0Q5H7_9NEIS|nr:cytochrome c oxidase assembly factor Coa1 family protein [Chitiniphilus eburneus]TJZ76339.1 hypothetical protein FAZ21_06085 [Chitiniphilus eburneus]
MCELANEAARNLRWASRNTASQIEYRYDSAGTRVLSQGNGINRLEFTGADGLLYQEINLTTGATKDFIYHGRTKMKTKFKFILIFIALLVIVSYFVGYAIAVNSKASESAISFIKNSEFVGGKFGKIEDVKLNFSGYSIRKVGPKGNAELLYAVKGSKRTGEVNVELESHLSDEWNIIKIRVVGETWIPSERSPEGSSH